MESQNKVLVVDDEVSLLDLYQIIFESAGYEVRGAKSGRQALEMITEEMPDLILLDVMMPGLNGIEVCREIRARYPSQNPCILMYTADDRPETRENSMEAGATGLIDKETPIFDLPTMISPYISANC
jgi:CheY-like chemotaxis protein